MANDDRITSFSLRIFIITRTNDYSILFSSQCMVIADDNIRPVGSFDWPNGIIIAIARKFIVSTDDIIMFAVNNFIVEAINIVVL